MSDDPVSPAGHHSGTPDELSTVPWFLGYVWVVLAALTALEAAEELFGIGGPSALYQTWFHDLVLAACATLVVARGVFEPQLRGAWLAFGAAMTLWCIGSVAWSLAYGGDSSAPYPTFADVVWLLWYPLMATGLFQLIRARVPHFELHRWMDGIAVTLVVLVAGFALVVQPAAKHTSQGILATVVDFSYPVLDVLLVGAILGIYGLLAWRPDTMWILLGAAILMMSIADAAFAVQEARGVATDDHYDFVWTIGALLIAMAAWARGRDSASAMEPPTGLRAVALALFAQALAIGVQIYGVFRELAESERVLTAVLLVVASAQIILTRPRPPGCDASPDPVMGPSAAADRKASDPSP